MEADSRHDTGTGQRAAAALSAAKFAGFGDGTEWTAEEEAVLFHFQVRTSRDTHSSTRARVHAHAHVHTRTSASLLVTPECAGCDGQRVGGDLALPERAQ
ncbi:MAG: hypothetical protein EOO41_01945 [Methanobacteriota archaeon]|nr:MAG: hypothetical protein EOO41_01945 [Euryarchaeota archaeon]